MKQGTDLVRRMQNHSCQPPGKAISEACTGAYVGQCMVSNSSFDSNSSFTRHMESSTTRDMLQIAYAQERDTAYPSMCNASSSEQVGTTEIVGHEVYETAETQLGLYLARSWTNSDMDGRHSFRILREPIQAHCRSNHKRRSFFPEDNGEVEIVDRITEDVGLSPLKIPRKDVIAEFPEIDYRDRTSTSKINDQDFIQCKSSLQGSQDPGETIIDTCRHVDDDWKQPDGCVAEYSFIPSAILAREPPNARVPQHTHNCSGRIKGHPVADVAAPAAPKQHRAVMLLVDTRKVSSPSDQRKSNESMHLEDLSLVDAFGLRKYMMQNIQQEGNENTDQLGKGSVFPSFKLHSNARNSIDEHYSSSRNYWQEKRKESSSRIGAKEYKAVQETDEGLQLVSLLLKCATAVAQNEKDAAGMFLEEIYKRARMYGDAMQRLSAYFAESLAARLVLRDSPLYNTLMLQPSPEELFRAFAALHKVSPCFQFAHFTSNQAIVEAFEGHQILHVIDINMSRGFQWASLLQSLASRPGGAPSLLHVTGVGRSEAMLRETALRLSNFAKTVNISFEFDAIVEDRLENLSLERLVVRQGEAVAVNCVFELHRLLNDNSGRKIRHFINTMRRLRPSILTIVEQEANHNAPTFLARFMEALQYYAAIFDSLDASFPQQSDDRLRIEQVFFARQIKNIVACEDAERIERHEKSDSWKYRMENAGFQLMHFSEHAVSQAKLLLQFYPCDGYRLIERDGLLSLGWQERQLITASAWTVSRSLLISPVLARRAFSERFQAAGSAIFAIYAAFLNTNSSLLVHRTSKSTALPRCHDMQGRTGCIPLVMQLA